MCRIHVQIFNFNRSRYRQDFSGYLELRDHSYVLEEDFHTLLAIHQLKLDL